MLEGAPITFSFGQISGVTAGFGYKRLGAPKDGGFWIAAGLKVKAFQMLEVQAVAVVEWGTGLRLGIFAVATASMPPQLIPGGIRFAYVELGLTATLDADAGTLFIDGQLAPSSFILAPDCRLSGGFALYAWFGEHSDLKGDWVFSLGGYHRQYTPPPQYPQPPRLGISWQFSNAILIRVEAYFAIMPAVCMGGGRWNVSLQLGPLEAFYEAHIDFLINFQPFHFIADGAISVSVRFVLDLWLVTLNIAVDIAASLHIEGPPIHGTAHVGTDNPPGISIDEMIQLACEKSEGGEKASLDTITASTPLSGLTLADAYSDLDRSYKSSGPRLYTPDSQSNSDAEDSEPPAEVGTGPHVLSVESGLVPSGKTDSKPSSEPWVVQPVGFAFSIACKIPIDKAIIETEGDHEKPSVPGSGMPIFAKPMKDESPISSVLIVKFRVKPTPADKMLEPPRAVPLWENNRGIIKKMPAGLWGKYSKAADPAYSANNRGLLDGTKDATVELLAEVSIAAPSALPAELDALQPFEYKRMFVSDVEDENKRRSFPCPYTKTSSEDFSPVPVAHKSGQWDAVVSAWRSAGEGCKPAEDAISLWKKVGLDELGWEAEKLHEGEFAWQMPKERLPELLDNFDSYYLWPPYLTPKPRPSSHS
ncbi:hypothetical protein BKA56DRAFT_620158 [Ilyonectria sp. MPI-CAGE-AT-0026]|nr:hypothetical protein BKA56DRAFT_620158 [Ilyonectria sp. MPI-CAGE-AT-0026]